MMLGRADFDRARAFVRSQARDVDRALMAHEQEGGPAQAVLDALAAYQNDDGGFGRALEPDFRLDASSPMATSIAFQVLRRAGATGDEPMVRSGIAYLLGAYDAPLGRWTSVPREVNEVPRAPWWGHDAAAEAEPGFRANPSAELAGYLQAYPELDPAGLRWDVTRRALDHLDAEPDALEMHDAVCYLRLAESLAGVEHARALAKLDRAARATVALTPAQWDDYGATPLLFAPSPDAPLAAGFGEALGQNLDWLIGRQGPDGGWAPNWSWGQYEDVWPQAEREWKGRLTVDALKTLRDFGRIDLE